MNVVSDYFKQSKKPNPFKNGAPGEDWWVRFMKRHPELSKRKPQALQMVRARAATPEVVNHWFHQCLKPALDSLGLMDKPNCIYNVDESGFPLSGRPAHVICKRGMKSPQTVIGGSGRENITVQVCVSAAGQLLPPYIVYTGKYLMVDYTNRGPLAARYAVSQNGWMTTSSYIDWFRNLLIPSLPVDRPILLILDGHSSHVSYEVRQLAIENQIHMLKLPPHLTHLLQPLDVGVFKPMKAAWYSAVADFTRRNRHPLSKRHFPEVLSTVWQKFNPETAKGGFRGCGIYPFSDAVISINSTQYAEPFVTDRITCTSDHADLPSSSTPALTSSDPSSSVSNPLPSPFNPSIPSDQSELPSSSACTAVLTHSDPSSFCPCNQPSSTSLAEVLEADMNSSLGDDNWDPLQNENMELSTSTTSITTDILPPSNITTTSSQINTFPLSTTPSQTNMLPPSTTPLQTNVLSPTTTPTRCEQTTQPLRNQLKDYFAKLLVSARPQRKANTRKRLVGIGESLTSDEAMKILKQDMDEKKKLEEEKAERKRIREEKKKEKEAKQNGKKKGKASGNTHKRRRTENHMADKQTRAMCPECEMYYDMDEGDGSWIECEQCFTWYHAACVGLEDDDVNEFICESCK